MFLATSVSISLTYLIYQHIKHYLKISPLLLTIVVSVVFALITISYVFTILFEVINPEKYKRFLEILIEVDEKIYIETKPNSYMKNLIIFHLVYVIIRAVDLYYEFSVCRVLKMRVIVFLLLSMISDFEVFNFIIECNELARRFEKLNAFLLKNAEFELQSGLLMKTWNRKYKMRWIVKNEFQSSTDIFVKISQATKNLNGCYHSTVSLLIIQ